MALIRDEGGQAVIEYILLLVTVVGAYLTVAQWMGRIGFMQKITRPITGDFAKAYQYGDIKAKGFEEGAPERHPRAVDCQECFRIFINPESK